MFTATRQWFRRNRTPIAVGVGVVGAGYVATQYLLAKLNDARERMSSDRIAKENLRRRFEQNQEDCTFTVLALLPTVTSNIIDAMNTEGITYQIQHMKSGAGGARSVHSDGAASVSPPSIADTLVTEDEGRSLVSVPTTTNEPPPPPPATATADTTQSIAEGGAAAAAAATTAQAPTSAPASSGAPPTPTAAPKRKTKRQLWDELTISSITRAYTLLYTVGLLVMLTRIQLNLLGRRSYLSSVVSLATGSAQATINLENNDDDNPQHALGSSDFDVNRKYLAFSWWLLNRSWADVMTRVEAAVRAIFGQMSPRDLISIDTFADLTHQVRQTVEHAPLPISFSPFSSSKYSTSASQQHPPSRWLPLVLPPPELQDYVLRESGILADSAAASFEQVQKPEGEGEGEPGTSSASSSDSAAQAAALRRLLDETADLVDSPTFSQVLSEILDAGFATLIEHKIAPGAFDLPPAAGEGSVELSRLRSNKAVQLPKVLSVLTRQAHTIGSGMPNEYLQEMEAVRDLEAFAAVVYSSNWESEIREDGLMAAEARAAANQTSDDSSAAAAASMVDESLIIVDSSLGSLESAWDRAQKA